MKDICLSSVAGRGLERLSLPVLFLVWLTILCHRPSSSEWLATRQIVLPVTDKEPATNDGLGTTSEDNPLASSTRTGTKGLSAKSGRGVIARQTMAVQRTNNIPTIIGQDPNPLITEEDNPIALTLENLLVTDEDTVYPEGFTFSIAEGENYSVTGSSIVPAKDFTGAITAAVTVSDGENTSDPYALALSVVAVNDAPVITGQTALTIVQGNFLDVEFSNLTVSDPDNEYPQGFTMVLHPGPNYSVAGQRITPAPAFRGELSVDVWVNDGQANSDLYPLSVTVTAANGQPVITGQHPVSTPEDTPIELVLTNLIVSDDDSSFPSDFSLTVLPGENYSRSGNTVTPSKDFFGSLGVNVKVSDGTSDSEPFELIVDVLPVNDPPIITGQNELTGTAGQPLTILLTDLLVDDPDNSYPAGFTLTVFNGANYSLSGHTITPVAGFTGTLSVNVSVNDGELNSNVFELSIAVQRGNSPPVITGQVAVSIEPNTSFTIQLGHLIVEDADDEYPVGFSVTVQSGTDYTLEGNTITPTADFMGTLKVPVRVSDGQDDSAPFDFSIQVVAPNEPPTITGQQELSTNEDEAFTIQFSHLTVVDPDDAYPNGFTLIVSDGPGYSVSGATITPNANFYGELNVPVRVNDGISNSPLFQLKIVVDPVNDAPYFDPIADQTINENAANTAVSVKGISKGPNESAQTLTFVAHSGNTAVIPNPSVNYNGGTTATITFAPLPSASGQVTITLTAVDSGPSQGPNENSFSRTFRVTVSAFNDPPTLDPIDDVVLTEDSPQQSIGLTGISAGGGEIQALKVSVASTRPELFEILEVAYTSPQATGQLLVRPALNANGNASTTVTVTDDGTGPGTRSRTFTIRILPVNDPPEFVSEPVLLAVPNERYEYVAEIEDVESASLPFKLIEAPSWLRITNVAGGRATVAGRPPSTASGTERVIIRVSDGEHEVDQAYTLTINRRPTVQDFSVQLQEDDFFPFSASDFDHHYADDDGDALSAIHVAEMPSHGNLKLGDQTLVEGDVVSRVSLADVRYHPDQDYWGTDAFRWRASDGRHLSVSSAAVEISVAPVNDPPVITLEVDTLVYDVTGEPAVLTSLFQVTDPDDDSLVRADITFRMERFEPEWDRLVFRNTGNIKGSYDFQMGRLSLVGPASIKEYNEAIRTVEYNYLNTVDPLPGLKTIALTVHDGTAPGDAVDRLIYLEHTFVELEIPSGFTPNGDHTNDTWIITRPGGLDQLGKAIIRVFNHRGVEVYRAIGFDSPWDGTQNGEQLPAGSYFFTIDLMLRNKKTYRGLVTILR